ncbi:Gfo/Idh/MocA family oxidoreductase [Saliphagus sp. LR7]|uniref:Gfo/Idh/MocA family oxidoreductase n=1 Tax=Saliphagus sp. LR7 TaxID=2282654 RepID=UPI000DF756AE|nr:Gfo/Idh/MocA family oxidoreductase [Saliphagus sp. LR7]
MIDVGILGLDTSHAEKFAAAIDDRPDATVAGVWDGGKVREESYVSAFREEYGAVRYDRPDAMVEEVDAAMVLTADWDRHRPIAEGFLEAGVPTCIDKPIAGHLGDVEVLQATADRSGTPICGGSAVPHHPSIDDMRDDDGGHDLFAAGYNGPFYYGVHLTDTARRVCDADWTAIEPTTHGSATAISFADGSTATLRFDGPTNPSAFGFLDVGETIRTARINGDETELERMYDPFIDTFLATARGERDDADWLFDAATLLLGVQAALENGVVVEPGSPELAAVDRDGAAFVEGYEPLY